VLKLIEAVALTLLLGMFAMVGLRWSGLPDSIPTHFNAAGLPDHYGPKGSAWLLPVIATFLYLLLTVVARFAISGQINLNVPAGVDARSPKLQSEARQFLSVLKMLVMATFAYIAWSQTSGSQAGLGRGFLPVMLIAPMGVAGVYLLRMRRYRRP